MWKTTKSEKLIDSEWVKVDKNDVVVSNGVELKDFYKVTIKDCAAIVALTEGGDIVLKKEYRYCYGEELIEIPAGVFETGEDGLKTAKRELLEETGYASDDWLFLGKTVESSAKLTNYMYMYLAKNCKKVAEQSLDATEDMEVFVVPLERAVDMVMRNEINCNSSANGILKAARMLGM